MIDRVQIPIDIASEVLFASDRVCCVCQTPGRPVQIHHIDSNPANNSFDNFAVLCLTCHNDTQIRGGFDRKLTTDLVRRYRADWLDRVRTRREEADRLLIQARTLNSMKTSAKADSSGIPEIPSRTGMREFVATLPTLRRLAYDSARLGWDSGITAEMMRSSYHVIDVFRIALLTLARFYPDGHFDGEDPRDYFSELIASRFRWHRYHHSTSGMASSGTIVGPLAASDVIADVEEMIEDLVCSLTIDWEAGSDSDFQSWRSKWRNPP